METERKPSVNCYPKVRNMTMNNDEEQFFQEAQDSWYLDKLYQDLENARGKILTPYQKLYLAGILCGKQPIEIDRVINPHKQDLQADGTVVRVTLNKQIYPSLRKICERSDREKFDYRSIVPWLTKAGYRKQRGEVVLDTPNELLKNMWQQFIDNQQLMENPDFKEKVESIKRELKEKMGFEYEIIFLKKGSLIIGIEGSTEALAKLAELFQSGELKELIGLPVIDIHIENNQAILTQDTEVNQLPITNENSIKLTKWFDNIKVDDWLYDIGIQASRLVRRFMPNNNMAVAVLRGDAITNNQLDNIVSKLPIEWLSDIGLDLSQNTTEHILISLLNSSNLDCIKFIAYEIGDLTNVPTGVINTLASCITTIGDSKTRWQLALTLGKLDPEHTLGAVGQTKTIELPNDHWLDLFLALRVGEDDLIDVLVEVTSATEEYLPVGLQVSLLDETEEVFLEVLAKEQDRYLSLEFMGAISQFFSVKFSLGGNDLIDNFVI